MIGVIILAAGIGSRFIEAGGAGNKLNAIFPQTAENSETLFERTLMQVLASKMPVHVVTRPDNTQVQASCSRTSVPVTLIDSAGTGDSIAAGVRDTPDWNGWLIHLADMPFVTPDVFETVAGMLHHATIVRPYWQDKPGHPVGFSGTLRRQLLQLQGDHGARELFLTHPLWRLDLNIPAVTADIDHPEHLLRLIQNGDFHATSR